MDRPSPSLGPGASPPLATSLSSSSIQLTSFLGGSQPYHGHHHQHTTSMAIRHEIQRFESVHPSIYAIYDLIELVPDPLLAQQIREHVVCIEGKTKETHFWKDSTAVRQKSFWQTTLGQKSWDTAVASTIKILRSSWVTPALMLFGSIMNDSSIVREWRRNFERHLRSSITLLIFLQYRPLYCKHHEWV